MSTFNSPKNISVIWPLYGRWALGAAPYKCKITEKRAEFSACAQNSDKAQKYAQLWGGSSSSVHFLAQQPHIFSYQRAHYFAGSTCVLSSAKRIAPGCAEADIMPSMLLVSSAKGSYASAQHSAAGIMRSVKPHLQERSRTCKNEAVRQKKKEKPADQTASAIAVVWIHGAYACLFVSEINELHCFASKHIFHSFTHNFLQTTSSFYLHLLSAQQLLQQQTLIFSTADLAPATVTDNSIILIDNSAQLVYIPLDCHTHPLFIASGWACGYPNGFSQILVTVLPSSISCLQLKKLGQVRSRTWANTASYLQIRLRTCKCGFFAANAASLQQIWNNIFLFGHAKRFQSLY